MSFELSPAERIPSMMSPERSPNGGQARTLQADVEQVRAIRSRGGCLGSRGEVGLTDAPLGTESLVGRDFIDDVHDCLCCGVDGFVGGRLRGQEAAVEGQRQFFSSDQRMTS